MAYDLRLLSSFVVLAEELHFGRAAARLNLAQPALSGQIRRLEGQLGLSLFERDTRKVTLAPAGEAFLPKALEALAAADAAEAAARATAAGFRGVLRIGVDLDVPAESIARLDAFVKAHPDIEYRQLRGHQGHLIPDLTEGRLDAIVGWPGADGDASLEASVWGAAPTVAVLARTHPEATRGVMPREVFARHPIALFARSHAADAFDYFVAALSSPGADRPRITEVPLRGESAYDLLDVAAGGEVLTMAHEGLVESLGRDDLVAIPFDPPINFEIALLWRRDDAANAVLRALREYAATAATGRS